MPRKLIGAPKGNRFGTPRNYGLFGARKSRQRYSGAVWLLAQFGPDSDPWGSVAHAQAKTPALPNMGQDLHAGWDPREA